MFEYKCPYCKFKEIRSRKIKADTYYCTSCKNWIKLNKKQNMCLDCNKRAEFMETKLNRKTGKIQRHYFYRCKECSKKILEEVKKVLL